MVDSTQGAKKPTVIQITLHHAGLFLSKQLHTPWPNVSCSSPRLDSAVQSVVPDAVPSPECCVAGFVAGCSVRHGHDDEVMKMLVVAMLRGWSQSARHCFVVKVLLL